MPIELIGDAMYVPRIVRLLATGIGSGAAAFALTGTFHWAYLAALGSVLWLFSGADEQPRRSVRTTEPPRERTRGVTTQRAESAS